MNKNVFESCPKYLGALTWNHPHTRGTNITRMQSLQKKYTPNTVRHHTIGQRLEPDLVLLTSQVWPSQDACAPQKCRQALIRHQVHQHMKGLRLFMLSNINS